MQQEEIKPYIVHVQFFNEVTREQDLIKYNIMAKTMSEIEQKVKDNANESFIAIESIQLLEDYVALY